MSDRVALVGMKFFGRHGVLPSERARGQRFLVDIEVEVDLREAGRRDDLSKTVDYRRLYGIAQEVVEGPPLALLEAVAEAIAGRVLVLPQVAAVKVRVRKPEVILGGPLEAAMVEIRREQAADRALG
ncbi:MAG: dihydroneopterin aldolase [Armatimonadota bacterium]|nr:dihydroneopterin aldolase [Armatimonadota bacterium]